jgi:uncharacterized membrane protein YcaP (DUF421 family)
VIEVVLRSTVVFVVLFVLVRATGKRELAQLSAFELVLLMVLGDVVQQAVTEEHMSITGGAVAASTLTLLVLMLSVATHRLPALRRVVDGTPVVVLRNGIVDRRALAVERLTLEDVRAEARQHGIADLADVRWGILETDGRFSFITNGADTSDDVSLPPDRGTTAA